jgi:four helix bundle protein
MLDYERLDVYQTALDFAAAAFEIRRPYPGAIQSYRTSCGEPRFSIPLNIAEGAGRPQAKDRAHFHAIARGSAMECGAILDLLLRLELASPSQIEPAKVLLVRAVAMLSRMCR